MSKGAILASAGLPVVVVRKAGAAFPVFAVLALAFAFAFPALASVGGSFSFALALSFAAFSLSFAAMALAAFVEGVIRKSRRG